MLLKPELFRRVELVLDDLAFLDRIQRRSANRDQVVQRSLDAKIQGWEERDGVVTWNERVYVPVDWRLREDIIREHHDSCLAGHPGHVVTMTPRDSDPL